MFRRSVAAFLSLSLSMCVYLQAATPATRAASEHTPFVTVLLRDWDRYDTNHDGVLTTDEIDHAVQNYQLTGDDAARRGNSQTDGA